MTRRLISAVAAVTCLGLLYAIPSAADRAAGISPDVRLGQGWDTAHEHAFYYTTQGTVILPASWLAALRATDGRPVMDPARMKRLGFLYDDRKTSANPNNWPIGFALDSGQKTGGVATVGFTCAACHTSQLTYRGTTLRIDGGQGHINLDAFKKTVTEAMIATGSNPSRRAAFERQAVALGFPKEAIAAQLQARYDGVLNAAKAGKAAMARQTVAGPGRTDALAVGAQVVFNYAIGVPTNTNSANAPVDYPYLWNIWNFNWVQYNASLRQPMSRNIGEAIGVGAITNFVNPATGELNPAPQRWRTSINVENLHKLEAMIVGLQPPVWPERVLGKIDRARALRGKTLFTQNCAMCHGVRRIGSASSLEWSMRVLPLSRIGTDPMQSNNWRLNHYDGSKLGLSKSVDAATGLRVVTDAIRSQAYIDDKIPRSQWPVYNGFGRPNEMTSPCGYKARPLVGVWATAPFLHNGSVPSVFALLSESRPTRFRVGGTEFDPRNLGLAPPHGGNAMVFDTMVVGNSNSGHWFTNDRTRVGRIGRKLQTAEKYDIIEYLKSATFADYPRTVVHKPDPEPCVSSG